MSRKIPKGVVLSYFFRFDLESIHHQSHLFEFSFVDNGEGAVSDEIFGWVLVLAQTIHSGCVGVGVCCAIHYWTGASSPATGGAVVVAAGAAPLTGTPSNQLVLKHKVS